MPSKTEYRVESGNTRLTLLGDGKVINGFTVEVFADGKWHLMSTTTPLSHLICQDKAGQRQEADLSALDVKPQGKVPPW